MVPFRMLGVMLQGGGLWVYESLDQFWVRGDLYMKDGLHQN